MNSPVTLSHRLNQLMEETRIYTEPHISRRKVACMIHTNEMYLHNTIRRYYDCAFSDYISRLRMQYAVDMLKDPDYRSLPVAAIAIDAGFGSRMTFYRQFKEQFGMTPDQFRRSKDTE